MKSKLKFAMLSLVATFSCAGLVGCGGGGGGGGSSDTAATDGGAGGTGGTGSASLSWSAPTQNADGSTLTDLAGYRIYYGTAPGNYTKSVTINGPYTTSYTLSDLAPATYYMVIKAFDTANNESAASPEQSKPIL